MSYKEFSETAAILNFSKRPRVHWVHSADSENVDPGLQKPMKKQQHSGFNNTSAGLLRTNQPLNHVVPACPAKAVTENATVASRLLTWTENATATSIRSSTKSFPTCWKRGEKSYNFNFELFPYADTFLAKWTILLNRRFYDLWLQ